MTNSATLTTAMFRYLEGLTAAAEREGFDVDLVLVDLPYESVIWEVILDITPISNDDVDTAQVMVHLSTVDSSGWDADIFDVELDRADDALETLYTVLGTNSKRMSHDDAYIPGCDYSRLARALRKALTFANKSAA